MSRYIDADALIESIKNTANLGGWIGAAVYHIKQVAIKYIDDAPISIDLVRCAECHWARPRTLKGETGYRCVFYRVDKAESGYCDNGEREGE